MLFIDVLQEQRAKHRLNLHAFVVMPDHVHILLTPAAEISLEKTLQYIKGGFSFRLKSKLDVWERGYTNHRITDRTDYLRHRNYIHQNPVDANLSSAPHLFAYSSANPTHLVDAIPSHLKG